VQEGGAVKLALASSTEDHEGTRVLLRTLLSLHPEIEVVGEAENGEEADDRRGHGARARGEEGQPAPRRPRGTGSLGARRAKR
jgi:hypothetical protein